MKLKILIGFMLLGLSACVPSDVEYVNEKLTTTLPTSVQKNLVSNNTLKNVANWTISCKPSLTPYSFKKLGSDDFQFVLEKGDQGNCQHDGKDYWEGKNKIYDFSERQEILSMLPGDGEYLFSAKVHVQNLSGPALRSTIFQIHDTGKGDARQPPATYLAVNERGRFRLSRCDTARGPKAKSCKTSGIWLRHLPKEPFQLTVRFKIKDKNVWADYYINDAHLISAENKIWGRPFVKIGIYRINARGKTIQTYRDVALVKVVQPK